MSTSREPLAARRARHRQRTLRSAVRCAGVGLHSGAAATLVLRPASEDSGLVFVRTDRAPAIEIPALASEVIDTQLATSLGRGGVRVGTVEHLLSALRGSSIDNARIELDGPEVPILDGSAAPFVFMLRQAGVVIQDAPRRLLMVRKPVQVRRGDSYLRIVPADRLSVSCTIDFDHPLIKDQKLSLTLSDRSYHREIARARTFALRREVENLQAKGLARGGSLENAIVVDEFDILNPEGLRYRDEFVRHKILDLIGDLALCGLPVIGAVTSHKAGHSLNQQLVRKLCAARGAAEVVETSEARRRDLTAAPAEMALPEGI